VCYIVLFIHISGVRQFRRETLIVPVSNIESREWKRNYNCEHNIPAKYLKPVTLTTWSVFSSVLRDTVGKDFILKQKVDIIVI